MRRLFLLTFESDKCNLVFLFFIPRNGQKQEVCCEECFLRDKHSKTLWWIKRITKGVIYDTTTKQIVMKEWIKNISVAIRLSHWNSLIVAQTSCSSSGIVFIFLLVSRCFIVNIYSNKNDNEHSTIHFLDSLIQFTYLTS